MKSASEQLHGLLMQEEVGYKFTLDTLRTKAQEAGLDVTDGAITGFIHRAQRFGRVCVYGKAQGANGRKLAAYEIVDRDPWDFKPKSHGSNKGRKIKNRQYNPVPDLTGLHSDTEPLQKHKLVLDDQTPVKVDSLFMRLFDLAAEVEALEKKSLKDYSTDELIAELKTRVK